MKDVLKLLAPYATAIASAIAVYTSMQTRMGVMEYRQDAIEERSNSFDKDLGTIKDLLYSIDTKMNVYATIIEERTAKKVR